MFDLARSYHPINPLLLLPPTHSPTLSNLTLSPYQTSPPPITLLPYYPITLATTSPTISLLLPLSPYQTSPPLSSYDPITLLSLLACLVGIDIFPDDPLVGHSRGLSPQYGVRLCLLSVGWSYQDDRSLLSLYSYHPNISSTCKLTRAITLTLTLTTLIITTDRQKAIERYNSDP